MANKKRIATSVAAVATAAALLLGGTFAWQSVNQTALNEASDVINPGGRLHNDMWYVSAEENNNDIYVENFAEEEIFARVRLSEYMEIVLNEGTPGEINKEIIGSKTEKVDSNGDPVLDDNGNKTYDYEYVRFTDYESYATELQAGIDDERDVGDGTAYWTWQMGGETVYMPTFNMNKDSLAPDLNGIYEDGNVGTISNRVPTEDSEHQYSDWTDWANAPDPTKTANEIWDYDSNTVDELADLSYLELAEIIANGTNPNGDAVTLVENTHTATTTQSAQLISMSEWLSWFGYDETTGTYDETTYNVADHGNYWVYDDSADGDGWVYWSAKLGGGDATGLLLNGTSLNQVMDDTWYYAIEATGQFCTPDDTGVVATTTLSLDETESGDGTGFYAHGETVSAQALAFLEIIGMTDDTPGYDDEENEQIYTMHVYILEDGGAGDNAQYMVPSKSYGVKVTAEYNEFDDTGVILNVKTMEGRILTAGADYELGASTVEFEEDTSGEYQEIATTTIIILNDDLVGETIVVEAVADQTGNIGTNEIAVHYEQVDVNITLYDTNNAVAGTQYGGTLTPNATYDVVATIQNAAGEDVVIYSTLNGVNVAENIKTEGLDVYVHAGKYTESNYVNENGQLVVGDAETFNGDENEEADDGGVYQHDSLTISVLVDSVRIYESADAMNNGEEPSEIYYAYDEWDIYPTGQEKYDVSVDSVLYISRSSCEKTIVVSNGNDANISDNVTYQITGNTDDGTTISGEAATEDHDAQAILTIGADESTTKLTITATGDTGSGSKTVSIVYLDTLYIGDATSDEWNNLYINSGNVEKTYDLELVDYWGETVSDVTYELSDATVEGTAVNDGVLTLAAGEEASPMTLSATVDGETTDYHVHVTYVPDTDAPTISVEKADSFNQIFTIDNLSDEDFPLTVNMYYLDSDVADYDSETAMKTITITKAADGVEYTEEQDPADVANLRDVTMTDGTVTIDYNLAPPEFCYLHAIVTDAAGNTASTSIEVSAAVGCFVAGTQVQTVGGLVNIEDIQVGDQVYSIDLTTGEKVVSPVTWVQGTRYIDATYTICAGGEEVVTTYEHPFYVFGKEWVAAEDLAVGDKLMDMNGDAVEITNIVYTPLNEPVQVYNFTVDGTHNYLITEAGLLVHNVAK